MNQRKEQYDITILAQMWGVSIGTFRKEIAEIPLVRRKGQQRKRIYYQADLESIIKVLGPPVKELSEVLVSQVKPQ